MSRYLFPLSLFLSALLLFIIQPMVAKILLPLYGGTPAVWTVCMLFFQMVLLAAYGYAWILSRIGAVYRWRWLHLGLCLVSLLLLPLMFSPQLGQGTPEHDILLQLVLQVGLPLLVLATSAPLLQFAFSQSRYKQAEDPYFLYAASNIGSLLALLAYPFFVERFLELQQQFVIWSGLYFLYLFLLSMVLFAVRFEQGTQVQAKLHQALGYVKPLHWIFLSFVACSLMLSVSFYITTDVAVTPLFWVLPLALYLLSFIVTFAKRPWSHAGVIRVLPYVLILPVLSFILGLQQISVAFLVFGNLLGFFFLALFCHGELVRRRPPAQHLTAFYFYIALGGCLAGLFNGLLAPRLFNAAYEYPLIFLLALSCLPKPSFKSGRGLFLAIMLLLFLNAILPQWSWLQGFRLYHGAEILALIGLIFGQMRRVYWLVSMSFLFVLIWLPVFKPTQILSQARNFYGIKQVFDKEGVHVLINQSTLHGFQIPGQKNQGTFAYYGAVLPVMKTLQNLQQEPLQAMVIGLGTGSMACQFRPQDNVNLVEIDEQVIKIASNPKLFSYLRDCPPKIHLLKQDGLMAVKEAKDNFYDVLVLDAFSSDAIPVHLLTQEAVALYQQKLKKDGVILANISNRHLRLLPVLSAAARPLDLIVLFRRQASIPSLGQFDSEWAILTTNERLAFQLTSLGWHFLAEPTTIKPWTNRYSNVISLLKW
jgi:hypothetical protein